MSSGVLRDPECARDGRMSVTGTGRQKGRMKIKYWPWVTEVGFAGYWPLHH